MSAVHTMEERENTKSLKAWWSAFTKVKVPSGGSGGGANLRKASASTSPLEENRVFGAPLRKSLKYASVAISMAGDDGNQYVWGYVPVIVAKVGLYLKENAVETEGVFRIAGSQKRMRELQETFDLPPRYGKDVDWSRYSIHDAASVLRRYLNQMPEPIIPLQLYNEFRNIMIKEPFDVRAAIKTYRLLITSSPPANQYLLLYVLDLLAVFARASDKNLMPASNLAVIFQPGMFSHPTHLSSANEHKIAVQVLEFLIEHQDHFVLGLSHPPPANVSPADLTVVSQPAREDEVYFEPSDSDEDLGELEAHRGGGAALMDKRSASTTGAGASAGASASAKRRLYGKRNAATGGVEMQPSKSLNVLGSGGDVERERQRERERERERVNNQVIGAGAGGDSRSATPPAVRYALAADDAESSLHPVNRTPSSSSGSKIKRSKTTPTRRTASGTVVPHGGAGEGDEGDEGGDESVDTTASASKRRGSGKRRGSAGGGASGASGASASQQQQQQEAAQGSTAASAS